MKKSHSSRELCTFHSATFHSAIAAITLSAALFAHSTWASPETSDPAAANNKTIVTPGDKGAPTVAPTMQNRNDEKVEDHNQDTRSDQEPLDDTRPLDSADRAMEEDRTKRQSGTYGISAYLGLMGLGAEVSYRLDRNLGLRTGIQALSIKQSFDEDGIEYDSSIDLNNWYTLLDWYPFNNSFHLSTGLVSNRSRVTMASASQGSYTIGGSTYEGDLTLNSRIRFPKLAPYLGFGWANHLNRGLSVYSNFGLIITDQPKLTLSASGTANEQGSLNSFDVTTNESFQNNLQEERAALEETLNLDNFKLLPSANFGIRLQF